MLHGFVAAGGVSNTLLSPGSKQTDEHEAITVYKSMPSDRLYVMYVQMGTVVVVHTTLLLTSIQHWQEYLDLLYNADIHAIDFQVFLPCWLLASWALRCCNAWTLQSIHDALPGGI